VIGIFYRLDLPLPMQRIKKMARVAPFAVPVRAMTVVIQLVLVPDFFFFLLFTGAEQ